MQSSNLSLVIKKRSELNCYIVHSGYYSILTVLISRNEVPSNFEWDFILKAISDTKVILIGIEVFLALNFYP